MLINEQLVMFGKRKTDAIINYIFTRDKKNNLNSRGVLLFGISVI